MNPNATALESLCRLICHSASVRYIDLQEGRVWFAPNIPFESPVGSLPLADFCPRNVRLEIQKIRIESVEVE